MHKTQHLIIIIGIILVACMSIFPPWLYVDDQKSGHPMGYAPLWKPPVTRQQNTAELFGVKLQVDGPSQTANTIDFLRLLAQIGILSVVGVGAIFLLKKTSSG